VDGGFQPTESRQDGGVTAKFGRHWRTDSDDFATSWAPQILRLPLAVGERTTWATRYSARG